MIRAALLLSVALLACGRGDPASQGGGSPAATALLAHLPPDTEVVVSAKLTDLASWPLWRRLVGVVTHEAPEVAARIASKCGLDPWTVLDDAALALPADPEGVVVAVETTFDRARIHDCLTKAGEGSSAVRVEDGAITKYHQTESTELAAWFGERIALAVPQRMDEQAALEPLIAVRPIPAALQPLLARVDRSATVWAVGLVTPNGLGDFLSILPLATKPTAVHVALHRKQGMTGYVALVFADASGARDAAALFERALKDPPPPLVPWRDALRIETRQDEVRIVIEMNVERAKALDDAVIALLPEPTSPPPPPKK